MYLLAGLVFLLSIRWVEDVRLALHRIGNQAFLRTSLFRACVVLFLLLSVPPALVEAGLLDGAGRVDAVGFIWVSAGMALAVSVFWYGYLAWLDAFEPEQRWRTLSLFLVASGCTFLVWPLTALVEGWTGARLDGTLWNDWWYSFLVIGGVEEAVKLLPVLVMLAATKWVDEPFDLLFYGCVSALGFAFVENTMYLERTGLHAMAGRALMASVSHMFDTSVICYGLAMARYRQRPRTWWRLPLLWLLASAVHGFYDLWLLAPGRPELITVLFYFGTMQVWVVMKNNLLNISPHYRSELYVGNTAGRYRIFNGLLAIFMAAYVIVAAREGRTEARDFLMQGGVFLCATLSFLSISFSSYVLVRGYVAPFRVPRVPLQWVLPRMQWDADLAGRRVELSPRPPGRAGPDITTYLPVRGTIVERVAWVNDTEWYLFRPDTAVLMPGYRHDLFLLKLHVDHTDLSPHVRRSMWLRGVRDAALSEKAVFDRGSVSLPVQVMVRELPQLAT